MQDTHTYTAELERPDIKKATQISKIISNVIYLSESCADATSFLFCRKREHTIGGWVVNTINIIKSFELMTSRFCPELPLGYVNLGVVNEFPMFVSTLSRISIFLEVCALLGIWPHSDGSAWKPDLSGF